MNIIFYGKRMTITLCDTRCDYVQNIDKKGLSGWDLNAITCIFIKHRHAEKNTHRRGRGNVTMNAEIGVVCPQVNWCEQPPDTRKGKEQILPSSLQPKKLQPC